MPITAAAEADAAPTTANYDASELAKLQSLDELLPANLFTIEVVIFKRLNAPQASLAIRQDGDNEPLSPNLRVAQAPPGVLGDPGEPLLLNAPRQLPSNLFVLSPSETKQDPTAPFVPADATMCWPLPSTEANTGDSSRPAGALVITPEDNDAVSTNLSINLLDAPEPNPDGGLIQATDQPIDSVADPAPVPGPELELQSSFDPSRDTAPASQSPPELAALDPFTDALRTLARPVPANSSSVVTTPYLTLIQQLTAFAEDMEANEYRRWPMTELRLSDQARRLDISPEFQILEHMAWQQHVPERSAPQPLYIQVGEELTGYLAVTLGRYLHTEATLWLTPSQAGPDPISLHNAAARSPAADAFAQLEESRRMRSAELHYFDHPLFGMLVRIDKAQHPERVQMLFTQFNELLSEAAPE